MSDDLVEHVARGLMPLQGYGPDCPPAVMLPVAAALVRVIRAEALEEAAKVAEDYEGPGLDGGYDRHLGDGYETRRDIAAAIRAMIPQEPA